MCEAETWASLGEVLAGMGLAAGPMEQRPTAAQPRASSTSIGRADIGREGRANVLELKRPGAEAPGKVSRCYAQEGRKTVTADAVTRGNAPLAIRVARKL